MKAISLHPEPAMNVAEGRKWIETRPRRCNYRGRFAVQATLPLGAVVASAVLTDCVPIVEDGWPANEPWRPAVVAEGDTLTLYRSDDDQRAEIVDDQRPFGDFSPGRWALLLDDIKPTTERCPYCWGTGHHDDWPLGCLVCGGAGECEPIPARGQQVVPWEWTP